MGDRNKAWFIYDADMNTVCKLGRHNHVGNARLIVAAPEMVEALGTLLKSLEWEEKRSGTTYHGSETARALLERIEGTD